MELVYGNIVILGRIGKEVVRRESKLKYEPYRKTGQVMGKGQRQGAIL